MNSSVARLARGAHRRLVRVAHGWPTGLLALGLVACDGDLTSAPPVTLVPGVTVRFEYTPTWGLCPAERTVACGHDLAPAGFVHLLPLWQAGASQRLDQHPEVVVPADRELFVAVQDRLKACCLDVDAAVTERLTANGVLLDHVETRTLRGVAHPALRLRVAVDGTVTP
jgi:hypothetical protein